MAFSSPSSSPLLSLALCLPLLCLSTASAFADHSPPPAACEFFAATDGSDGNAGSRAHPLQSPALALEKALDCAQQAEQAGAAAVVSLFPGVFHLEKPLEVSGAHALFATTATNPVLIRTAPPAGPADEAAQRAAPAQAQAQAVLSGALHVANFTLEPSSGGRRVYAAMLRPNLTFSQLYGPDGSLRQRARLPNASPASAPAQRGLDDGSTLHWDRPLAPCAKAGCPEVNRLGFVYEAGAPLRANFTNAADIEVLVFQAWGAVWHPLRAIVPRNRTLLFAPAETNSPTYGQFASLSGRRYLLENVLEALDAPGEWYYNRATGRLSVIPLLGDPPPAAFAVDVPVLDTVVSVANGAHGVTLDNLGLRHTHTGPRGRLTAFSEIAAVQLGPNVTNVAVRRCHVHGTGAQGIALEAPLQGALIEDTIVENTGGEGIAMVRSTAPGLVLADVLIQYTRMNNTGLVFLQQPSGMRVRSGVGGNVTVQHCDVGYVPYGGILVGWQPGGPTPPGVAGPAPDQVNITVRYNHVHDFGLGLLSDFGGLYISSDNNICYNVSDCYLPTLFDNNIVSHGRHYNYGSQGFYTDEQVRGGACAAGCPSMRGSVCRAGFC